MTGLLAQMRNLRQRDVLQRSQGPTARRQGVWLSPPRTLPPLQADPSLFSPDGPLLYIFFPTIPQSSFFFNRIFPPYSFLRSSHLFLHLSMAFSMDTSVLLNVCLEDQQSISPPAKGCNNTQAA